jgi:hypothetical protein
MVSIAWLLFDDTTVVVGNSTLEIQQPCASIAIGWVHSWH